MTIADDVSSARRVHSGRSTREVVVDLGLDRRRQHLLRAVAQHVGQDVSRRLSWELDQLFVRLRHGGVPPCPFGVIWVP